MNWIALSISLAIPLLTGFLSGKTFGIRKWYKSIKKPPWQPPSWLFAPVWTFLYALMGVSLYLLWTNNAQIWILGLFLLQLFVNFMWSPIFFRWKRLGLAVFTIFLLDLLVIFLIISAFHVQQWAGIFLIPYLLWILFATSLNYWIWRNNP